MRIIYGAGTDGITCREIVAMLPFRADKDGRVIDWLIIPKQGAQAYAVASSCIYQVYDL